MNPGRLLSGLLTFLLVWAAAVAAQAEYFRQTDSDIDPDVFRVDEREFLGVRMDPELRLVNSAGEPFKFGDLLGQPLVLVFSYYSCDGSCSAVNGEVKTLLEDLERQTLGEDFRVVTLSFDRNDTLESLTKFQESLQLPDEMAAGWTFGLFENPDQIEAVTGRVGFKFFWAAQDRTFYHPNAIIVLSPDGRVARYLYLLSNSPKDLQLALLDARRGDFRPNEVIEFAISLCYSYNYEEGRYTYNIPVFVGVGSFLLGISLLVGSLLIFRKKRR